VEEHLRSFLPMNRGTSSHRWRPIGDGPQRAEFETLSEHLGLSDGVRFHGFQDDPQDWMVESNLLVFPLLDEGMPLVLMQAVQVGLPVIASDIEPVRELTFEGADLPLPGDERSWKGALIKVLEEGPPEVMFVPEKCRELKNG